MNIFRTKPTKIAVWCEDTDGHQFALKVVETSTKNGQLNVKIATPPDLLKSIHDQKVKVKATTKDLERLDKVNDLVGKMQYLQYELEYLIGELS